MPRNSQPIRWLGAARPPLLRPRQCPGPAARAAQHRAAKLVVEDHSTALTTASASDRPYTHQAAPSAVSGLPRISRPRGCSASTAPEGGCLTIRQAELPIEARQGALICRSNSTERTPQHPPASALAKNTRPCASRSTLSPNRHQLRSKDNRRLLPQVRTKYGGPGWTDRRFPRSLPAVKGKWMRSNRPPGSVHRRNAVASARYATSRSPTRRWGAGRPRQRHRRVILAWQSACSAIRMRYALC